MQFSSFFVKAVPNDWSFKNVPNDQTMTRQGRP